MELVKASLLANGVLVALYPFCSGLMIAGSIRRQKADVGDVDIVAMPKDVVAMGPLGGPVRFPEASVWSLLIPKELKKLGLKVEVSGQELHRCSFADGFQVDVYRARPETWGVILLVRTGSRDHNVKLCSLAKSKGLKLSAAEGIVTKEGFGKVTASRSEEEIFAALGLVYVEPKNREVLF